MASHRLPFLLVKGEASRTPSIAATPHHSNLPANSLVAPQAGAERAPIMHYMPVPLREAQGAAIPFCAHPPL